MKLKAVIILLIICSITFASTIVLAVDSFSEATSSAETWLNGGKGESPIDQKDVTELSNTIWSAIMIIGTVLAVIIAMVLGIQFMLGSTEQKAEVKEKLIPFIVGCVILFGSAGIWKLAMNLLKTVQDQTDTTTIPSYVTDREEQEQREEEQEQREIVRDLVEKASKTLYSSSNRLSDAEIDEIVNMYMNSSDKNELLKTLKDKLLTIKGKIEIVNNYTGSIEVANSETKRLHDEIINLITFYDTQPPLISEGNIRLDIKRIVESYSIGLLSIDFSLSQVDSSLIDNYVSLYLDYKNAVKKKEEDSSEEEIVVDEDKSQQLLQEFQSLITGTHERKETRYQLTDESANEQVEKLHAEIINALK